MLRVFAVFLVLFLVRVQACAAQDQNVKPLYRSCKEILKANPDSLSGQYHILIGDSLFPVYCDMNLSGGGWTFLPRAAVTKDSPLLTKLNDIFTDKTQVLLRFQRKDGTQPFTLLQQLPRFKASHLIQVSMGSEKDLGPYLHLTFLPGNVNAQSKRPGFQSNGVSVEYNNCGKGKSNYFQFYPNHHEKKPSDYHKDNLIYEKQGVAVDWRRTGQRTYSFRQMPNDYFYLTVMHFGGCGCYTSSDRWTDALGTAIGLK